MKEKEFVTIRHGNRSHKYIVLSRRSCYHEDGRFGLLVQLCKAGRNDLHGAVVYEAFETPQGIMEFLGESPEQDRALARKHEKDCDACDGQGWILNSKCRQCYGSGRIAYTPPPPIRRVTLIQ